MGRVLLVLAGALVLTGCVGSIDGEAFDREVQSRGGGIGADQPLDALAALEEALGEEPALHSVFVGPGYVTIEARVPGTPSDIDSYRWDGDSLSEPDPVTGVGASGPVEAQLFRPGRVAFDDLDAIVDQAIDAADLEGGYAEYASIQRPGGPVRITVSVKNERHTVTVPFGPDGTLREDGISRS